MVETGTIKWFNDAKGYGFIWTDVGDEIICEKCHVVSHPQTLFEFQRVEFERFEWEGRTHAGKINVIETRNFDMYDYEVITAEEEKIHLTKYLGQVLLVVNTASECGLTPQYESLQKLYDKYKWQGNNFEILAFPSNHFAKQEPGTNEEIIQFCRSNYDVKFTIMSKTNVIQYDKSNPESILDNSGPYEVHPLFDYLSAKTGEQPQWNFHKYLVSKNGQRVLSFNHFVDPMSEEITSVIEEMLKEQS